MDTKCYQLFSALFYDHPASYNSCQVYKEILSRKLAANKITPKTPITRHQTSMPEDNTNYTSNKNAGQNS